MRPLDDLDVIILNWRTADLTIETARRTMAAAPGAALVVVDNGSGDGSADRIRAALPGVTVIALPENVGFGAGMNRGIFAGSRPLVVVQNSDAQPDGDAFAVMAARFDADPRLGAVVPAVREPGGRFEEHHRREPPPWRLVADLLPLIWRVSSPPPRCTPEAVDWLVSNCATMLRRSAIERIGGFDPGYFLGWEEWDMTRRLREAGWRIAFEPAAQVVHIGAASTPRTSPLRSRLGRRSILYHLRKHHGPVWYAAGRVASACTDLVHKVTNPGRPGHAK